MDIKNMKVVWVVCSTLIFTVGLARGAAPTCPIGDICVTATERENMKIVLVDLTPPFTPASCTARTGSPDCIITILGPAPGPPGPPFLTQLPDSLVLDLNRRYIYDQTIANVVRRFDPVTNADVLVAGPAQGIANPYDMILDPTGQFLYVSNYTGIGGDTITIVDLNAVLPNGTTCLTPILGPQGLEFDAAGNLFVLARNTLGMPGVSGIYRIDKTTCAVLQSNSNFDPTNSLDGLAYDPSTNLLFATSNAGNSVYSINPVTLGAGLLANGTVPKPDGIISDGHGTLYVASRNGFVYSVDETTGAFLQLTPVPTIDDLGIEPARPPVGVKTFTPSSVGMGGSSTLTINITNPNLAPPLMSVGFTDNLPASVIVSTPPAATNTCGGTFTPLAGDTILTLSGATLTGSASCTVTVSVTDSNPPPTSSQNCVTVTSQNGGPGNQSCDTLTVIMGQIAISKGFGIPPVATGTTIPLNGSTKMAITVSNPNAAAIAFNLNDPLPAGLVVATPVVVSNTCGGTFTPALAGGAVTVSLAGGNAPPMGSCTVSINVTGTTTGLKTNTVTLTTPGGAPLGTATASLTVAALAPVLMKSFNPASVVINNTSTLTLTARNPNVVVELTNISFTDNFPPNAPGIVIPTPNGLTTTCPNGTITAIAGSTTISLTGLTLAAGASCAISVNVTGTAPGDQLNTTGNPTGLDPNGNVLTGTGVSATLAVIPPPSRSLDPFQIRYAANLDRGDSFISFTNGGILSGFDPAGRICVNVYTFDPAEELISCCACLVTPNEIYSLSAQQDLMSNPLTAGKPTSIVIKLLASVPVAGNCNAASPNAANLVRGMRAWGTTLHALPTTPVTYGTTETPFSAVELSPSELSKLTGFCGFIQTNGSGFGICSSCRTGALGAERK